MEKKLNILFIHEVSYLNKPIFEMHEFPELLVKRGHKVSFIQFNEGYRFWDQKRPQTKETIRGRVYPESKLDLYTPFQLGVPGIDRLLALATFVPLLRKILKQNKIDVIVQLAVPTYGTQTSWIAKAAKVPVVFRALDVSHKIRKTPFSGLIKLAEKAVYSHATLISANNPGMGEYCRKLGNRPGKSVTNLPPLDLKHFASQPANPQLRQTLGIHAQEKVITYMGSFFYFSGLKETILSFAQQKSDGFKLLIIGGGEQEDELHALTKRLNLEDKVIFTGFIDYSKLPEYFALSHVAINPMQPGLVSNTAFPHKVLQYIAAGLPVVSTKLAGLHLTFGDAAGITWADKSEEVIEAAVKLGSDKDASRVNSQAQITMANRLFGLDIAVASFEETLGQAIRLKS